MIRIAIDGPGGAGKSTVARAIAKQLSIIYVDTGALYRSIGLFMLRNGISPVDKDKVAAHLSDFTLELKFINGEQVILLDGEDVKGLIRTPEVSMAASAVSAIPEVREYLLNTQRSIAKANSVIMDGRDIGTVILPDAEVKIFLTASPEARAKRRYDELISKGEDVTYQKVYDEMVERDRNDSTRAVAPCIPAKDAIFLDNSKLNFEQTTEKILSIIKKKRNKLNRNSYMITRTIISPIVRFFSRIKVEGVENIPMDGGFVLCSNHIAASDVLKLGVSCPRQLKFLAKAELFSIPILSSIMKSFGAVKLDRSGSDVKAIRSAIELAKSGDIVAIFPQGHRYPGVEPTLEQIKNGTGLIAYRSECDVIPAFIKTKKHKYSFLVKKTIVFGKPIPFASLGFENGNNEEFKRATEVIFSKVLELGGIKALPSSDESNVGENS